MYTIHTAAFEASVPLDVSGLCSESGHRDRALLHAQHWESHQGQAGTHSQAPGSESQARRLSYRTRREEGVWTNTGLRLHLPSPSPALLRSLCSEITWDLLKMQIWAQEVWGRWPSLCDLGWWWWCPLGGEDSCFPTCQKCCWKAELGDKPEPE